MTARDDLTCSWTVTRRGEEQPCDLTAVAWSLDPRPEFADADPFPVCARHTYAKCALPLDKAELWTPWEDRCESKATIYDGRAWYVRCDRKAGHDGSHENGDDAWTKDGEEQWK